MARRLRIVILAIALVASSWAAVVGSPVVANVTSLRVEQNGAAAQEES
jgi:hypothetical protein